MLDACMRVLHVCREACACSTAETSRCAQEVDNIDAMLQERSLLDELRDQLKQQAEAAEAKQQEHQTQIDQFVNELRVRHRL